jgi:hypothetical protein
MEFAFVHLVTKGELQTGKEKYLHICGFITT